MRIARILIAALLVTGAVASTAKADPLLTFFGGIGVDPVANVAKDDSGVVTVTSNVIRGVSPGGFPWVIRKFKAVVTETGEIDARGKGLLLAGGEGIGTPGGQSVFATLFCGAPGGFSTHNTDPNGVALTPEGNFEIKDMLTPPPPASCATPVLLIRSKAGRWFAAGIPGSEDNND
jgi:hypothetical protein